MVVKSSFSVGRRRLSSGASNAGYTRDARASMAQVIANYRTFVRNLKVEVPKVLYDALEPTFNLSQVYVPKDTGTLKASGFLIIDGSTERPHVSMGYGANNSPPYAAKVHENMEFRHKSPTRAKFLQVAIEEDYNNILNRIVYGLRENF
jgi:hypothetical protein